MSAVVMVSADGDTLHWVQRGRMWRAERLCRDSGFAPWVEVSDWKQGPQGGRVLDESEVRRLVPPHGVEVAS